MTNQSLGQALVLAFILLAGCSKQEELHVGSKFDPEFIAAEADKGNLAPLTELNAACGVEIEKYGKRLSACTVQDEVRRLSKPINIRF